MIRRALTVVLLAPALAGAPPAGESAAASATVVFEAFWSGPRGSPSDMQAALWDSIVEAPRRALYEAAVWETRDHADGGARKALLLGSASPLTGVSRPASREEQALEQAIAALARFKALFSDAPPPAIDLVLATGFDAESAAGPGGAPCCCWRWIRWPSRTWS